MLIQTEQLLSDLKLRGFSLGLTKRLEEAQSAELGYEAFLNLMLEDEKLYRSQERVRRLVKNAKFKGEASLEGFYTKPARGVDKKLLGDLSQLRFLRNGQNIVISGPTGVGKSYLASAIGHHACRNGIQTMFLRVNTLIEKFHLERAKGTYLNYLKRLTTPGILVLDDFGIRPMEASQYQDFYDLVDERGENKSIIITTQLLPENFNEVIEDPVTCEAITDRLVANSIFIKMKGASQRGKVDKV